MERSFLNDVKNRFLSLPRSAVEGLEHEPIKDDFEFNKELGIGSFGIVYLVTHKKTKAKYALKVIDKTLPENLEEKKNFNREVEIMYKLNHPNIVKLYGHFEDERYCYFIMQFIPNKNLLYLIKDNGNNKNIKLIASVMKDLINAIYYLHNMKPTIIHRDIKPENILLDENNKAYLTDFGWSNYTSKFARRNTTCGTPLYLPPEMIKDTGHDETADIWCIGVLLFELLTGDTPFQGNNIEQVAFNIVKLNISWPPRMDPDGKDLISKILKLNGKDRLPIVKILEHKFFKQFFPNAVNELIKPLTNINRVFVVSKDDPNKLGFQDENPSNMENKKSNRIKKISIIYKNNNKNINNNINNNKSINNNINNNKSINNNDNNNISNNNDNNKSINNNDNNNNSKIIIINDNNKKLFSKSNSKGNIFGRTKTMNDTKIDLSKTTNPEEKKNIIKKNNNHKITISINHNSKSNSKKKNDASNNNITKEIYNNYNSTKNIRRSPYKRDKIINSPNKSIYTDRNYKNENKIKSQKNLDDRMSISHKAKVQFKINNDEKRTNINNNKYIINKRLNHGNHLQYNSSAANINKSPNNQNSYKKTKTLRFISNQNSTNNIKLQPRKYSLHQRVKSEYNPKNNMSSTGYYNEYNGEYNDYNEYNGEYNDYNDYDNYNNYNDYNDYDNNYYEDYYTNYNNNENPINK